MGLENTDTNLIFTLFYDIRFDDLNLIMLQKIPRYGEKYFSQKGVPNVLLPYLVRNGTPPFLVHVN